MVTARKWILATRIEGEPRPENFRVEEEILGELADGEFLTETEYISIDAGVRAYMDVGIVPVGAVVLSNVLARVVESKHADFPVGTYVCAAVGWRTHAIINPAKAGARKPYVLPELGGHSRSLGLGALGLSGNTAYFGFLEICKPQPGETVVISGAAGAVGSLVGQLAKIKGCRAIGIAGSAEKCDWLREELGFDGVINYKVENVREELRRLAPNGVDCYFDNVGGEITEMVRSQMNTFGRISVCGAVSDYNDRPRQVKDPQREFVGKQLRQEGFVVFRWTDRWFEGIRQLSEWVTQGKLVCRETVHEGFENAPHALIDMLRGGNIGKTILKLR